MQFWLVVSPTKTRALVVLLLAGFLSLANLFIMICLTYRHQHRFPVLIIISGFSVVCLFIGSKAKLAASFHFANAAKSRTHSACTKFQMASD